MTILKDSKLFDPRFGLRMIPYQFLYASLIMPVLLKLFGWF
jgi:hypothetical protein